MRLPKEPGTLHPTAGEWRALESGGSFTDIIKHQTSCLSHGVVARGIGIILPE
jgi:hypothetical protein